MHDDAGSGRVVGRIKGEHYVNDYKERYHFLCKHLRVAHIDYWEKDAMIVLEPTIYFQFNEQDDPKDIHEAIGLAMYGNHKYAL